MNSHVVVDIIRQALMCAFWLGLPLLVIGFITGVLVSLVQILTSIQDPAFGALPRLIAFLAAFILCLPWMIERLCTYTTALLGDFSRYGH